MDSLNLESALQEADGGGRDESEDEDEDEDKDKDKTRWNSKFETKIYIN